MRALTQGIAYALLTVVPGSGCLGCSQAQEDSAAGDRLHFTVVDSLLGPVSEIAGAGKSLRPPRGFARPPDSVWTALKAQFAARAGTQGKRLAGCFIDTAHAAGLLISTIAGLTLSSDTVGYFAEYRRSLPTAEGAHSVREGDYWVESVFVKNFLIVDSLRVLFTLVCMSANGSAMELVYFAPHTEYPQLVRHFESSIGSLRVIKPGG